MARIPTKESLGKPTWTLPDMLRFDAGAMAAPGRAQAALGESVARAGQALGGAFSAFAEDNKQTERYETARKFVDFQLQQDDYYKEQQRNMPVDGAGFREGITSNYDTAARTFFKESVPDWLKPEYDLKLRQRHVHDEAKARDDEYRQRDRHHLADIEDRAATLQQRVIDSPDKLSESIEQFRMLVDNSRLPPALRHRALEKFGRAVEQSHLEAMAKGAATAPNAEEEFRKLNERINRYGPMAPMRLGGPDEGRDAEAPTRTYQIGAVSAKYESGGRGVGFISSGNGDPGGQSYGIHQLSTKDSMGAFLRAREGQAYAEAFEGMRPGTPEFNRTYKSLADKDPDGFAAAQHAFYARTHYEPVRAHAEKLGFATEDRGVQEALFSMGVQHAGAKKIVSAASGSAGSSAEAQIRALYAARSRYVQGVELPAATKQSVINRYRNEVNDAVALAGSRGDAPTTLMAEDTTVRPSPMGLGGPRSKPARDSGYRSAEWLMDSFVWGDALGGYADMKNPEDAAVRRASAQAARRPSAAVRSGPMAQATPAAPAASVSPQQAYAVLKDYEDEATLGDLPPAVRAKILPAEKVGNEKIASTKVGDVRRLIEAQLPPSEGHATPENSAATIVQGQPVAGVDGKGRIGTMLDGVPDARKLSELPDDKRNQLLALLPEDASKLRTLPDGRKVSALDAITVGEVKQAFAAPLDQAKRSGQLQVVGAADSYPYRYLDHGKARHYLEIAQRNLYLKVLLPAEFKRIYQSGEEGRDGSGETVLDRAKKVLTPNQLVEAKRHLQLAQQGHKYITPIPGLPNAELDGYVQRHFAADPSDSAEAGSIKAELSKQATALINATLRERRQDMVKSIDAAPEVQAAIKANAAERAQIAMPGAEGGMHMSMPTGSPTSRWERLIEARLEVQKRIEGSSDTSQMPVLNRTEAGQLLGVKQRSDWTGLADHEQLQRLERAAQLADRSYGRYARQAFDTAVKLFVSEKDDRLTASGFAQKMIRGEPITAQDLHRYEMLERLAPSEAFLMGGRAPANRGIMTPLARPGQTFSPPADPRQGLAQGVPQASNSGAFAAPNLAQPQGAGRFSPQALAQGRTKAVGVDAAPQAAIIELLRNPTPEYIAEFNKRWPNGPNAQQHIDWWASRGGAKGAQKEMSPPSRGWWPF